MEKKRGFLLTIIIPVLILIMGNNPIMGYSEQTQPDKKGYYFEREVEFVSADFASTKQKPLVRLVGVILIFIPFIFFPFTNYFTKKAEKLSYELRYAGNDPMAQLVRERAIRTLVNELYSFNALYIISTNIILVIIGLITKISLFLYITLIYERVLNFILSFI